MTFETGECAVCEQPGHGSHFGAYTCRACAAFFRRTIVLKREYPCRLGGECCPIVKNERYLCRFCRFKKCTAIGMTAENVKCYTENAASSFTEPSGSVGSNDTTSCTSDDSRPSTSSLGEMGANEHGTEDYVHSFGKADRAPTVSANDSDGPKFQINLMSLTKNIRTIIQKQTPVINLAIPLTAMQRMLLGLKHIRDKQSKNPQYLEKISGVHHEEQVAEQLELVAEFMQCSPEFANLDLNDKITILRSSWIMLYRVEVIDRSLHLFGDAVIREHKFACYRKFYVDRRLKLDIFSEEDTTVQEIMESSTDSMLSAVAKPLLELKLTDYELVYVLNQLIWHVEGKGVSESCHKVADSYRDRISDELHDYYTHEMKIPRYADRLIKIMELVQRIEDYHYERSQFMNMMILLNVCKVEVADTEILDPNNV